jgi:hypothetical protein
LPCAGIAGASYFWSRPRHDIIQGIFAAKQNPPGGIASRRGNAAKTIERDALVNLNALRPETINLNALRAETINS